MDPPSANARHTGLCGCHQRRPTFRTAANCPTGTGANEQASPKPDKMSAERDGQPTRAAAGTLSQSAGSPARPGCPLRWVLVGCLWLGKRAQAWRLLAAEQEPGGGEQDGQDERELSQEKLQPWVQIIAIEELRQGACHALH